MTVWSLLGWYLRGLLKSFVGQGLINFVGEPGNRRLLGVLVVGHHAGSTEVTQRNFNLLQTAVPLCNSCARESKRILCRSYHRF